MIFNFELIIPYSNHIEFNDWCQILTIATSTPTTTPLSNQEQTIFSFEQLEPLPVIDLETAQKYIGLNQKILLHLIHQFQQELKTQKTILEKNFHANHIEALKKEIHKLKGSASYCGAIQLQTLAEAFMQETHLDQTMLQKFHEAFNFAIEAIEAKKF